MRTLLLADDSVTVQRVIALTFADEPIRVVTCGDGPQAIERMAAQRPDIVLAATTLPQVNGYDLALFMRSKAELKDVPVLLLAGAFETVDDVRLEASGANGVIEKPVEPNNVIGRVKQLLGLKVEAKPETTGRLITSAEGPSDKKLPVAAPPREVTSIPGTPSKELREQAGHDANMPWVDDAPPRSNDYLDRLEGAFDTLDQQLSGRVASEKSGRNPAGPLGQASGAPDARSAGPRPENGASAPGNPVFEVDDDWFGGDEGQARADARAGRRDIEEDLRDPGLQAPAPAEPPGSIFEVDDDWFAEDDKARAANRLEQHALAAEMGVHDIELPGAEPGPNAPAPVSDRDLAFGVDQWRKLHESTPPAAAEAVEAAVETAAPVAEPSEPAEAPEPPVSVMPTLPIIPLPTIASVTPASSAASRDVADDFAQLLAFEQGEHDEPPSAAAPEVRLVAPEITDEMLDKIAARVAERLNAGLLGEQLRNALTATVGDTVREIVSETSERLVRDEIERIKSKART